MPSEDVARFNCANNLESYSYLEIVAKLKLKTSWLSQATSGWLSAHPSADSVILSHSIPRLHPRYRSDVECVYEHCERGAVGGVYFTGADIEQ